MTGTTIYQVSLNSLTQEDILDITLTATPCRYRLLNCLQFTQQNILLIDEFSDFPAITYSAISYVWRGNSIQDQRRTFAIAGAEEADPISIDVLKHACTASIQRGSDYLWLDRLCIMQTSRDDKAWQISQMNHIYRSCAQCIVLPGGLGRLVHLHEETAWIHRAWTLQEVLAPASAIVLFAWRLGPGECMSGDEYGTVDEVIPYQSAVSSVVNIINACATGEMFFTRPSHNSMAVPARIFGVASPNVRALGVTMSKALCMDPDAKNHAIWQCALMRTSSRPIDMVFSIMGLFGVTLDPHLFHKDDRLAATIALAKKILDSGGNASWLGASIRLQPCSRLSTFPAFPQTSVAGKALVRTADGMKETADMMDSEYPNSLPLGISMPGGRMDDAGYLIFSAKAARVVPMTHQELTGGSHDDGSEQVLMTAVDGTVWRIREHLDGANYLPYPPTFAVLLGWFQKFHPGATMVDGIKIRLILIEEHAPEKFHLKTFFSLDHRLKNLVIAWDKHTFSVGGPDPLRQYEYEMKDEAKDPVNKVDVRSREESYKDDVPFIGSIRFAQYFNLTKRRYDIPRHEATMPLY